MCAGGDARENLQQVLELDQQRTRAHQASVVLSSPSCALSSDKTIVKGIVTLNSSFQDLNPDPPDPYVFGSSDPDPLVRSMDPDPNPNPSIIKQK